jgi:hypothetical protein
MIGVEAPSSTAMARWPAIVVIQRVAELPCAVTDAVEQKGAQAGCAAGMWPRSATVLNGLLNGAGMARGPGPAGFGSARQQRRGIEERRVSGGRSSTHF